MLCAISQDYIFGGRRQSASLSRRLKGETLRGGQPSSTARIPAEKRAQRNCTLARNSLLFSSSSSFRSKTNGDDEENRWKFQRITKKRIDRGNVVKSDRCAKEKKQNGEFSKLLASIGENNREDSPRNCFSSVRSRRLNQGRNDFCLGSDVAMEIERWVGGTFVSIPSHTSSTRSRVLLAAHSR